MTSGIWKEFFTLLNNTMNSVTIFNIKARILDPLHKFIQDNSAGQVNPNKIAFSTIAQVHTRQFNRPGKSNMSHK